MIYVVQTGDTLDSIALQYAVSPYDIAFDNQIDAPYPLVVGQALWIQERPATPSASDKSFFGYAYPFIENDTLLATLPYLQSLYHFSYGYTENGDLLALDDANLSRDAAYYNVRSVLVLTPFSKEGTFNNQLVNRLVENEMVTESDAFGETVFVPIQERLTTQILDTMQQKGFTGIDVDFEYILPEDKESYVAWIAYLKSRLSPYGYTVSVALPPKISDDQSGLLYEGIDYAAIGGVADSVFLMTYEWGYTYGPPMAVAPIPSVRRVLDYAVSRIPPAKIYMGLPNYGYDWALPYERGVTKAETLGYLTAIQRARTYGAAVQYDTNAQAPFVEYTTADQTEHIIWFEDVRSMQAKFDLIEEYGFAGGGYWNLMRFFRANWLLQAQT
jgi:spore germination protein